MSEFATGYNAFKVGMRLTENPHSDLFLRAEWSKGWLPAKIIVTPIENMVSEIKCLRAKLQEASQLAADYQSEAVHYSGELNKLRAQIKEAQDQEPVASRRKDFMGNWVYRNECILGNEPLYSAPVIQKT